MRFATRPNGDDERARSHGGGASGRARRRVGSGRVSALGLVARRLHDGEHRLCDGGEGRVGRGCNCEREREERDAAERERREMLAEQHARERGGVERRLRASKTIGRTVVSRVVFWQATHTNEGHRHGDLCVF